MLGDRTPILLIATVALAVALCAPATAPAKPGLSFVQQSIPGDYFVDYAHRAKPCRSLITPPWVSWLSYDNAKVSDLWRVYASSSSLCRIARTTADAVIFAAPYDDGAGGSLTKMLAFGTAHHRPSIERGPRPAGRRWACAVLPSFWGQQAWDLARAFHHSGAPLPSDFAAASGPAAGAGYCELGVKANTKPGAPWRDGQFFTWSPDTRSCQRHYVLKEIPDPNNPGQTTNPPFPAALWGDYNRVSC